MNRVGGHGLLLRSYRCTVLCTVAWIAFGSSTAHAQDNLLITCLPDRAVSLPGDDVRLDVWVRSPSGPVITGVTYQWTVSGGTLDRASAAAARWSLAGTAIERRHTASVDVRVNGTTAGSCSLGVWLAEPPASGATSPSGAAPGRQLRGEYVTRRAFIRAGQVGETGFGLYSYFLMREPATPSDVARATSFVKAFLDVLVGVADQENYVERRRLNGSYLPVTADPPSGLNAQQRALWAIEHYDYEHARRLLSLYPTLTGNGPFIVATPAPLRTTVRPMLPWDFSVVAEPAIPEAVNRFLNQAAQLYDWQNQSALQTLRDRLLTTVAGMFVGRTTAENWLQLIQ